jgi:hypothetical protein
LRHRHVLILGFALASLAAAPPASWRPHSEARFAPTGEPGDPLVIEGLVVSSLDGTPLRGVHVRGYHQDAKGRYTEREGGPNRIAGQLVSGERGQYTIRTVVPGNGEGLPHVHFEILDPVNGTKTFATVNLVRTHGAGSHEDYERIPYYAVLPKAEPPLYWAKVELAADTGFFCHFNLPAPAAHGTEVK